MAEMNMWLILAVVVVAAVYLGYIPNPIAPGPAPTTQPSISTGACPEDGLTDLLVRIKNAANSSNADWMPATIYVYSDSGYVGSISTSAGNNSYYLLQVPCDQDYIIKVIPTDGEFGVNSKILSADKGIVTPEGFLNVGRITGDQARVTVDGTRHGFLEAKAFDATQTARVDINNSAGALTMCASGNNSAGNMHNVWDNDGTDYENLAGRSSGESTSIVWFGGTSGWQSGDTITICGAANCTCATNETVGTDGSYEAEVWIRTNVSFVQANDYDTFIIVDADSASQWQEPSVLWDGQALSDIMSTLSGEEAKAYSSYEYAYKVPAGDIRNSKHRMYFTFRAQSGSNPSMDPKVCIVTRGNYLSIDGITVNSEMVKDDSANTHVFENSCFGFIVI